MLCPLENIHISDIKIHIIILRTDGTKKIKTNVQPLNIGLLFIIISEPTADHLATQAEDTLPSTTCLTNMWTASIIKKSTGQQITNKTRPSCLKRQCLVQGI